MKTPGPKRPTNMFVTALTPRRAARESVSPSQRATGAAAEEAPEALPGTRTKNPVGERTIAYARILVNGQFNENENGFDTELEGGDRVALVSPSMFCC